MTNEEIIKFIKQGDTSLMADLYKQNKRFIFALVKHIGIQPDNYEDAMQDAYFGLHEAVNGFDESTGYNKFLTYAKYHIQGAIQRGQSDVLNIPEHIRDTARKIKRMQDELAASIGRLPSMTELSDKTGFDIETIKYTLNAVKPVKSIYEPMGDDTDNLTVADSIEDTSITFEDDIAAADKRQYVNGVINEAVNELPEAEKEAIRLFYFGNMTYPDIAAAKNISISDVRRDMARGLRKLRSSDIADLRLDETIDRQTSFYHHRGLNTFNTTWTSATEQTVIERERIEKKIIDAAVNS